LEGGSKGWDASKVSEKDIFSKPHGIDLNTVNDSVFHLLGKTVKKLCDSFEDDGFRVLHIEKVLSTDRVEGFGRKQIRW
jgi:hypothetical protein